VASTGHHDGLDVGPVTLDTCVQSGQPGRALAAQDNLAEAFSVYGQLSECLRGELGVSPSPATRELYERLLAAT